MTALLFAAYMLERQTDMQHALRRARDAQKALREASNPAPLPLLQAVTALEVAVLCEQSEVRRVGAMLAQIPAANDEAMAPVEPEPTAA